MRVCRQRCFKKNWVVDLDVKAFLDSVPWDLMLKAVARHTTRRWVMLYVERWLKAPMQMPEATLVDRHLMRWARRKDKSARTQRSPDERVVEGVPGNDRPTCSRWALRYTT